MDDEDFFDDKIDEIKDSQMNSVQSTLDPASNGSRLTTRFLVSNSKLDPLRTVIETTFKSMPEIRKEIFITEINSSIGSKFSLNRNP